MNKTTKRRNAIIAALAGVALLLGGSTFALWSVQANLSGGTITAGNMDITPGETAVYDVSTDRIDLTDTISVTVEPGVSVDLTGAPKGELIADLASWRIVPGDTVAMVFPFELSLVGDNLVAALTIPGTDTLLGASTFSAVAGEGIRVEYQVFEADGTPQAARAAIPATDIAAGYFDTSSHEAVVTLVLYVTFDSISDDQGTASMDAVAELAETLTATLEQVRCDSPSASKFAVCS
ncbi:MAG: alternate-type signal peptide domain-containing protein [Propionibacteriaceae bacterium]|nr:alternate-type signal peptide domain-containing protein [Propionibacteriaceae bacterium]